MKTLIWLFLVSLMVNSAGINSAFAQETQDNITTEPGKVTVQPVQPQVVDPYADWDPFGEMSRIEKHMEELFQKAFSENPAQGKGIFSSDLIYQQDLNMDETDQAYIVKLDLKGVNPDKLDVQVKEGSLTLSGEYVTKQHSVNPLGVEQNFSTYSSFVRTISLPSNVDADKISTKVEQGAVIVTLPKLKPEPEV